MKEEQNGEFKEKMFQNCSSLETKDHITALEINDWDLILKSTPPLVFMIS